MKAIGLIAVNVFHLKWWELSYLSVPIDGPYKPDHYRY